MILIGLIIVFCLGFTVTFYFYQFVEEKNYTLLELLGLSFLVGIGIETIFMFGLDLLHIKINILSLLITSFIVIGVLVWINWKSFKELFQNISYNSVKPDFNEIDLPWLVILIIILFLLVGSVAKSLYWPTAAFDSVAGYDLMGKVISAEGKLQVSLFETNSQSPRGIYPPLVEGSFAFAYIFGSSSSKIITSLTYLSLILIFYALLRKYVTKLNSIIFCLILIVTPEMFAHSSLSLTNIPGAAYAALGIIYLVLWFERKERAYFFIASILLGLNVWARNDGVVFNATGFLLLLYFAFKNKTWKDVVIFSFISFLPLIVWTLYLKFNIGVVQDRFVDHLFWDAERFALLTDWIKRLIFNMNLYGLTFYIFLLAILINIKNIFRNKTELLLMILLSFLFYSAIYYQFDDVKQDPLNSMMRGSFKRALFYFIPLVLFYASTNKMVNQIFNFIENFRISKTKAVKTTSN